MPTTTLPMRKLYLLLISVVFTSAASATILRIEKIGIEEGLSNSYVRSMAFDGKGFLWVATESGLNRFDGREFKVYRKIRSENVNSISANELNRVYVDPQTDILWIATQREGLNAFDSSTGEFVCFRHDPDDPYSIITNDITDVTGSADGNLWIATYHKSVDYYDKSTGRFIHYNRQTVPGLPSDNVWTVRDDGRGSLFIGHVKTGLSVMSLSTKHVDNYVNDPADPSSLPGNRVNAIFTDKRDNVWVGTDNGLALFDRANKKFVVFRRDESNPASLISNYVNYITQLDDGRIFIGTENGGISVLELESSMFVNPRDIVFENIRVDAGTGGLSSQTIHSIIQDSFGNVWMGTYGGGINFMSNAIPFFSQWRYSYLGYTHDMLSHRTAWGICSDEHGNFWVGTDGGGINYFEDGVNKRIFTRRKGDLTDNAILSAMRDSRNNLWFGTYRGGINVYDTEQKRFVRSPVPQTDNVSIRCLFEDEAGNVWIATSGGLFMYDPATGNSRQFRITEEQIPEDDTRAVCSDAEGNLWVGTFGEGLTVLNRDMEKIAVFDMDNGFYSNTINHIFRDRYDCMWVATGEGLLLFDNGVDGSFTIFNEDDGLSDSFIRAVTDDEFGNVWFSTNNGISRYLCDSGQFHNYGTSFGVPAGSFMSGSVARNDDGVVCFGSENGACYFNTHDILNRITPSPIHITGFRIYDDRVESLDTEVPLGSDLNIRLSNKQNTFAIFFSSLNYAQRDMTEYSYMLKGLSDQWFGTNNDNMVIFRDVPPGEYRFRVRSRIRNHEWSSNVAELKITIPPPVWKTWWAKTIYVLAAIVVMLVILRFYKNKLRLENSLMLEKYNHRQEQMLIDEKLRFYTNIAHELRTPLTLISGPLDDLLEDKTLSEDHVLRIGLIRRSVGRLLGLVTQILDFRKVESQNKSLTIFEGDVVSTVRDVFYKYKELNTNRNIELRVSINAEHTTICYDVDIVTTILDNLISNALKYTESGTVTISLDEYVENGVRYTEISVADTGYGISEEVLPRIFDRFYRVKGAHHPSGTGIGLALAKKYAETHRGDLTVESEPGVGSVFRFRIPTEETYPDSMHVNKNSHKTEVGEEVRQDVSETDKSRQIILVVEDNEEILEYVSDILSGSYKVITATDGEKGLEQAFKYTPDLVVSDIMMPVMDGLEMCRRIKSDIRSSHIPVILLTAKDSIMDRTEGYGSGADSYIVKPFNSHLLKSRVVNLLEARKKNAQLITEKTLDKKSIQLSESWSRIDEEFIGKVRAMIEQEIDSDKLDVASIAERMNMSHSTFYRKIKALTGLTANEYMRKIRIVNAEKLMLTGKYSISEIAFMVGFNSQTYFRQCFKEEYGMAPSDYLKNIIDRQADKNGNNGN